MEVGYLLFAILGAVAFYIFWKGKSHKWPPGPKGLPLLGNVFQLDFNFPHHVFTKWGKQFGDIYRINLLGNNIVVLSGYDTIRQALVTNSGAFAGRPFNYRATNYTAKGALTLTLGDYSERWRLMKKVVMNSLRSYGDGMQRIEDLALEASEIMIEDMAAKKGEAFDPKDILQETMVRVVANLIYAKTLNKHDVAKSLELERKLFVLFALGGSGTEIELMPWLRFFRRGYINKLNESRQIIDDIYGPLLQERKAEGQGRMECIIDALYKNNETTKQELLNDKDIIVIISEVLGAGITTSSSALYSLLALCVTKPGLQQHLQAEIDDVLGSRPPRMSEKNKLPYMNAAILEVLRYTSHVPTGIPHKVTEDTEIGDYKLPKGTEVWMNLWAMHHDEKFWDAPWDFRPERFLDADGEMVPADHPNRQRLMAFGAGRRVCAGENLAKGRLYILTTAILQHFTVLSAEDKPLTDPRQFVTSAVLTPQRYKIRLVPRTQNK